MAKRISKPIHLQTVSTRFASNYQCRVTGVNVVCKSRYLVLLMLALVAIFPAHAEFQWELAADPAALGWSAEKLDVAEAYSKKLPTESVMIVEDKVDMLIPAPPAGPALAASPPAAQ